MNKVIFIVNGVPKKYVNCIRSREVKVFIEYIYFVKFDVTVLQQELFINYITVNRTNVKL